MGIGCRRAEAFEKLSFAWTCLEGSGLLVPPPQNLLLFPVQFLLPSRQGHAGRLRFSRQGCEPLLKLFSLMWGHLDCSVFRLTKPSRRTRTSRPSFTAGSLPRWTRS